jgi:hypothetical protein
MEEMGKLLFMVELINIEEIMELENHFASDLLKFEQARITERC